MISINFVTSSNPLLINSKVISVFLNFDVVHHDLIKKNLNYFITTHSNHFLDLTIEKNKENLFH